MGDSLFARAEHRLYLARKKRKLNNSGFTVLSSNCTGAVILHDLCLPFLSPTVNLYFDSADYIKFLKNPEKYLSSEPVQVPSEFGFPVGVVEDITVYFMHYNSFEEAKDKWTERSSRVNPDNVFVMMTEKNNCTYELIKEFDSLPYRNKVIFTAKPYPEISSAVYIKGFENCEELGVLTDWKPGFLKRRYIDDFDYVSFFNH